MLHVGILLIATKWVKPNEKNACKIKIIVR